MVLRAVIKYGDTLLYLICLSYLYGLSNPMSYVFPSVLAGVFLSII
jgi:hypothetical protein